VVPVKGIRLEGIDPDQDAMHVKRSPEDLLIASEAGWPRKALRRSVPGMSKCMGLISGKHPHGYRESLESYFLSSTGADGGVAATGGFTGWLVCAG
jgi:hypothetical protein